MENKLQQELKLSKFCVSYNLRDSYALYHSRNMKLLFLDEKSFNLVHQFKESKIVEEVVRNEKSRDDIEKLIYKLKDSKLLVDSKKNEDIVYNFERLNKVNIGLMYLLPTDDCNFKCKYCFIEEGFPKEHKRSYMTEEIAKRGIDFFSKISKPNKDRKRRIQFYGGEPLLNKEIVKFAIKYIRGQKTLDDVVISIITNGSLVTSEIAKTLVENNVDASISLDGVKDRNDIARVFQNGIGTYESAVRGYKILKENGMKNVGISYTIGSHNLETLTEDVTKIVNELDINSMSFNIITGIPCRQNPFSTDISLTVNKMLHTFEFLRDKGVYEDKIMRKLRAFVEKEFYFKDCAGIGNQIVVTPSGNIGPCQAFTSDKEYFKHTVFEDFDIENDPIFNEWAKRMPVNMSQCQECEAISICGGGCPYQAKIEEKSLWGLDKRMCTFNKMLLEWSINDAKKYISKS